MLAMEPNHERLLKLVREARREKGISKQNAFIEATGLGRTTIQRFERGERLGDASYREIDWALGWAAGSCVAVLNGGEPTSVQVADASVSDEVPAPLPPLKDRIPVRVRLEVEGGELLDAERYDLTQGNGARIVTFLLIDPEEPGKPHNHEELRRTVREWERFKRRQRGLKPLPWEPGDPDEWKTDSEG
jgi:transcriptional regulator with XRE-family HTH domain